jgi:Ca2+/Na+ antiporter
MYFIIAIIVGAFLWYISRQTNIQPVEIEGKSILKFNPIFGLVGMVSMALGLFMPFYPFIINDFSRDGIMVMMALLIFFFGMGYWIFSWSRNHQVIFDDKEVTVINSNKSETTFQWGDIKDIKLNTWTSKYIVTLQSNDKVGIHQYLSGVDELVRKAKNAAYQNV